METLIEMTKNELDNYVAEKIKQNSNSNIETNLNKILNNDKHVIVNKSNSMPKLGIMIKAIGKANLEKSSIDDAFKSLGYEVSNFLTPVQRGVNMSSIADGGAVIAEALYTDFIDMLRDQTVLRQAGINIVGMPAGNLTLPVVASGSTMSWVGEAVAANVTAPVWEKVRLDVKRATLQIAISNQLLRYSMLNAEQIIQDIALRDMASGEDATYLLTGTGSSYTPKSLVNHCHSDNAFTMTGTPTAATKKADLAKLKKALAKAKVKMIKPFWAMTNADRVDLEMQVDANTNPTDYARELSEKGTLFGIPVYTTQSLLNNAGTSSTIILAEATNIWLGQGAEIEVEFVKYGTYSSSNTLVSGLATDESVLVVKMDADLQVGHTKGISKLTGVTWGV